MKSNRVIAMGLGLLTFLPVSYAVVYLAVLLPRLSGAMESPQVSGSEYFHLVNTVGQLNVVMGSVTLVLVGCCAVMAYRSAKVPAGKKGLWLAALLFGNVLALPVFWYVLIWRRGEAGKEPGR